ncbi:MAG: family efflux pump outer membrane protein [Acidobacteria bacterium]|nr:family efflux pump outer membrane protein [Acidobacteriota bacterium]
MRSRLLSTLLLLTGLTGSMLPAAGRVTPAASQGASERPALLTLEQALARMFERNPELGVSELEIQAASARIEQAGRKPNPEITAEAENLSTLGVGPGVFRYSENSLLFSQKLELGGKRELRVLAAEKDFAVASIQLEVKKRGMIFEASRAFTDVLAEQERFANQQALTRLAQQFHATVSERVAAGKVSPVEQTRAAVARAAAQLEADKRLRALLAAKEQLAALWGGTYQDIEAARGTFAIPEAGSGSADLCMENNPELKLAAADVNSRDAALALELGLRKPDLTVSAGFRYLNPERAPVWVAGISIPLPIHDKRQGAIAEARIRLDQSRLAEQALARRLRAGLAQARQDREIALLEVKSLTESTLPGAKEAAAAVEEGYRLGKFDYLNVLDAQRTYAELQGRFIEAVVSGLRATLEIERLARCDIPEAGPDRKK